MRRQKPQARSWFVPTLCLALAALGADACAATDQTPAVVVEEPVVLAEVGSIRITEEQVEETLAAELKRVEQQRHEIIERGMEESISQALLDLEAEAKGLEKSELVEQIYAALEEPGEGEVDAFYEARKERINRPKEEVAEQIRNFLIQQSRQTAYTEYLGDLGERYAVRRYLEPIRIEVAEGDGPAFGAPGSPVTIIEFSDFQCPYCQRLVPTIDQVKANYGDQVRVVFRQFPLPIHNNAQKAAEASLCAAEGGKFWEMHDAMFADLAALGVDQLKQKAVDLGLQAEEFADCLDSGKYAAQVAQDIEDGRQAGVTGTPAMFVNGRFISGAVPYADVAAVIDDELARQSSSAAQ